MRACQYRVDAKLKVIIIDDEALAREGLRMKLATFPRVVILGEYADGASALESLEQLKPDLAFVDIEMPGLDGLDLAEALGKRSISVVFTTAYDAYAIRAFELRAADYLLKPVRMERLRDSLERVREIGRSRPQLDSDPESPHLKGHRLPIKENGCIQFIDCSKIRYLEANGDYVLIHIPEGKHLYGGTLSRVSELLSPYGVERIHRSYAVNFNFVESMEPATNGEFYIRLAGEKALLKSGRSYRKAIVSKII